MSDAPWSKQGIRRLDSPDKNELVEQSRLVREAIRGEMNWGELLRNIGISTASGAATGAYAGGAGGTVALPGIGTVAGAGGGAAIGAALGFLGSALPETVFAAAYALKNNADKASWQAGDLQGKTSVLSDLLNDTDPQTAMMLNNIAKQYKDFIYAYVQKKTVENIQANRFMLTPEQQAAAFQEEYKAMTGGAQNTPQREQQKGSSEANALTEAQDLLASQRQNSPFGNAARPLTASRSRFIRLAAPPGYFSKDEKGAVQSSGVSDRTGLDQMKEGAKEIGEYVGINSGYERTLGKVISKPLQKISPVIFQKIMSGKMVPLDLALTFGAEGLLNIIEGLKGNLAQYEDYMKDTKAIITEINRLTNNDPKVKAAGDSFYSWMLEGRDKLAKGLSTVEQSKNMQPSEQA